MNKKKMIIIIIVALIICLIVILVELYNLIKLNSDISSKEPITNNETNNNFNVNVIQEENNTNNLNSTNTNTDTDTNTSNENEQASSENNENNSIDYNNSDYIFYNEEETGDVEYDRSQLNNFSFDIKGIPDQILQYIKDQNEFYIEVKEYIYLNGLVDATEAEWVKYEFDDKTNNLKLYFKLNNPYSSNLYTDINLNDNSIKIYE